MGIFSAWIKHNLLYDLAPEWLNLIYPPIGINFANPAGKYAASTVHENIFEKYSDQDYLSWKPKRWIIKQVLKLLQKTFPSFNSWHNAHGTFFNLHIKLNLKYE